MAGKVAVQTVHKCVNWDSFFKPSLTCFPCSSTVTQVVQAWSDEDVDPDQAIDVILEALHHPFWATGRSEVQGKFCPGSEEQLYLTFAQITCSKPLKNGLKVSMILRALCNPFQRYASFLFNVQVHLYEHGRVHRSLFRMVGTRLRDPRIWACWDTDTVLARVTDTTMRGVMAVMPSSNPVATTTVVVVVATMHLLVRLQRNPMATVGVEATMHLLVRLTERHTVLKSLMEALVLHLPNSPTAINLAKTLPTQDMVNPSMGLNPLPSAMMAATTKVSAKAKVTAVPKSMGPKATVVPKSMDPKAMEVAEAMVAPASMDPATRVGAMSNVAMKKAGSRATTACPVSPCATTSMDIRRSMEKAVASTTRKAAAGTATTELLLQNGKPLSYSVNEMNQHSCGMYSIANPSGLLKWQLLEMRRAADNCIELPFDTLSSIIALATPKVGHFQACICREANRFRQINLIRHTHVSRHMERHLFKNYPA